MSSPHASIGQGAILSDFHPDAAPDGPNFPARNRLISGLSLGVAVVEAPERSGALITVDFTADQGRDVFAVAGPVAWPSSAGCNRMLRDGARLARSADDILEDLRLGEAPKQLPMESPAALDEPSRRVLAVLTGEPRHTDEISASAGIPIASLASTLMTLELQGLFVTSANTPRLPRLSPEKPRNSRKNRGIEVLQSLPILSVCAKTDAKTLSELALGVSPDGCRGSP
ncbi:MAG TPA: DNA-processing protein DprA [Thermomicrobiales bacterium]|nr:DNA-processing protein DprA [Thermomicrobiales bacterium]